jgi:hypothetical protein
LDLRVRVLGRLLARERLLPPLAEIGL